MEFDSIKLTDIVPAEYNPRKISEDEFDRLTNSISEFGLVDPIIINLNNNKIIGGHQRYDVLMNEYINDNEKYANLKLIKLGDIGWVFSEDSLTVKDDAHEKALNIALNKISGEWDNEKLHELFVDLDMSGFDVNLTGFDDIEIKHLNFEQDILFDDESDFELRESDLAEEEEEETSAPKYITCPFCNKEFVI